MIRVALHNNSSLIGKVIKWQTRMPYTHASLVLPDNTIVEAWPGVGVDHTSLFTNHAKDEFIDIFSIPCTNTQRDDICEFALAQIGKPYDYGMVLAFVTRDQDKRKKSGKFFCSELVYAAIAIKGKVPIFQKIVQPWQVAPGHFAWSPFAYFRTRIEPKKNGNFPSFL